MSITSTTHYFDTLWKDKHFEKLIQSLIDSGQLKPTIKA